MGSDRERPARRRVAVREAARRAGGPERRRRPGAAPPHLNTPPNTTRRLKNTAYARDTESIMIMVTPRITINEEEETVQTGYTAPPSGGQL